jgi:3-oxoacyl-[acyl-carrier-protein] synthase-3
MKCVLNNIAIKAISTYLPVNILEINSLTDIFEEKDIKTVMNASGVERVHVASPEQTTSDMCFEAAKLILEKEKIEKSDIHGLVFVSQTPDYIAPATSVSLQDRLGLSKETVCFDISYGCSGYIYGIFQAAILISSGACENVLVLAGDTTTKLINPKDRAQRLVFGDCGSATLVSKGHADIGFHIGSDGSGTNTVIVPAGGFRTPSTEDTKKEFVDTEGNMRTLENLHMDGTAVFTYILKCGPESIKTLLEFMKWNINEVNFFALHQATRFTLSYLRKRLGIDKDKAPINIANYGNTGPTTIPLVLTDTSHNESGVDTSKWNKVLMSAYGVGLSWGSIACDLSDTHIYKPINKI